MHFDAPVLLYGAGREARSTRDFIESQSPGTKVYVIVDSGEVDIPEVEVIAPADLPDAIAARKFGTIVKSPGVSRYRPVFAIAREAGIAVTSNLNLWGEQYRDKVKVVAISGTKGKSTTATLAWLMLTNSGIDAGLGGNVGVAPLDVADKYKTVVFELSSYQTADMAFTPDIAAITNLSPEHTDWHRDVEHYYADKLNLIDRDRDFPVALGVGAKDNQLVLDALRNPARLIAPLDRVVDQAVVDAVSTSRLKGAHNLDNARLAAQLALAAGGTLEGVLKGIAEFKPLPHRLEEHRIGGQLFVNDSISTTPEATKAALAAFPGLRIALIAGGHERNQDYSELAQLLGPRGVTVLVCLPVTGDRLATATYAAAPQIEVLEAENLETAMQALASRRNRFDAVILSPGAPSYNQFKNFEERGHTFIALAEQLFGAKAA